MHKFDHIKNIVEEIQQNIEHKRTKGELEASFARLLSKLNKLQHTQYYKDKGIGVLKEIILVYRFHVTESRWELLYLSENAEDWWLPPGTLNNKINLQEIWFEQIHSEERSKVIKTHSSLSETTQEHCYQCKDSAGKFHWVREVAYTIDNQTKFFDRVVILDSVQRNYETHISLQEGKNERALASISRGVAHDFNNLLMKVLGYTELIKLNNDLNEQTGKHLEAIQTAVDQGARICRQVFEFNKTFGYNAKEFNFMDLTKKVRRESEGILGSEQTLEITLSDDYLQVVADETQLSQLFGNLISNASQALKESGKKNQAISIKFTTAIDQPNVLDIVLKDNGKGIEEKHLSQIFNEGFSTKKTTGHGVGMSIIKRVIDNHNGSIDVSSKLGQGTEIHLTLPIINNKIKQSKIVKQASTELVSDYKMVFVDDEVQLLGVLRQFFEFHGYQVMTFSEPSKALQYIENIKESRMVLVSDLKMPKMSGIDLVESIRLKNIDIPIVMISGDASNSIISELKFLGVDELIHKPFNMKQLLKIVESVIEKSELHSRSQ